MNALSLAKLGLGFGAVAIASIGLNFELKRVISYREVVRRDSYITISFYKMSELW